MSCTTLKLVTAQANAKAKAKPDKNIICPTIKS